LGLSGCATILAAQRAERQPAEVAVTVEARSQLQIEVVDTGNWQLSDGLVLLGEAWLVGNLARVWTVYPTIEAGTLMAVLWGGGITAVDAVLRLNVGLSKETRPAAVRVAWGEAGNEGPVAERELDTETFERTGRVVVTVPIPKSFTGTSARVDLVGRGHQTIFSAPATLARGAARGGPAIPPQRDGGRRLPKLNLSATLDDELGERLLRAGEVAHLEVTVGNTGEGDAEDVELTADVKPRVPGVTLPEVRRLGIVRPGEKRTVRLPVGTDGSLQDGAAALLLRAEDARGIDASPLVVSVQTRRKRPVELVVDQHVVLVPNGARRPRRGEQVQVQARVLNAGEVPARQVQVRLLLNHPDLVGLDEDGALIEALAPGEAKVVKLSCFIKSRYEGPTRLPLALQLTERHPGTRKSHDLALEVDMADLAMQELAIAPVVQAPRSAQQLLTDVDRPLADPVAPKPDAVGLVIGLERYNRSLPPVPWASRDAQAVSRYFQDALGVSATNLVVLTDDQATLTGIELAIGEQLEQRIKAGASSLYVYFAGHGTPDPAGGSPFLVPFDGQLSSPKKTCLPTRRLYQRLAALRARQTTVFLDACFTGATGRDAEPLPLLADARPILVTPAEGSLPEGLRVFTAAGPGEASSSHPEARHGLFTYFLLKALRREEPQFKKTIRVADLERYLQQHVRREALRLNRTQTPQVLGEVGPASELAP
jgi:hypothetical protein